MNQKKKIKELEQLLNELKASSDESAVTIEEVTGRRRSKALKFSSILRFLWKTKYLGLITIFIVLLVALPFLTLQFLKSGSTFTESKGAYLERITELDELATAESFTKVIVEREDNQLFGTDIGMNLPGTKRQLLVVIPGSVKAGVNFSKVKPNDISVNETDKTIHLTLPSAEVLGGPELFFDKVEIYSYEGLFRSKANINEAYDLADEAKKMIVEESVGQGILQLAEENAKKTLKEMFSITGYSVEIEFKEQPTNETNVQ